MTASRQIEVLGEELEGPLRREMLRRVAAEAFEETRARNRAILGYDLPESITTDGVAGKLPEEMRIGGRTTLTMGAATAEIIPFTLDLLERVSPRGRSNSKPTEERYYASHAVWLDGERLDPPYLMPERWTTLIFANLRPYSRKIERGLSKQRPNGVYEALVFPEVFREFGNTYVVSFQYRGGLVEPFGKRSTTGIRYNRKGNPAGKRRRTISDSQRARIPAIVVENFS